MSEQQTPKEHPIQAPNISLPTGGGAIKGIGDTFEPNHFTGTGGYNISFPVSPARGLEPAINLSYNTGSGNSPFGIGARRAREVYAH